MIKEIYVKKEDLKSNVHIYIEQQKALGFIVKNIFNNLDLGIISMAVLQSMENDFSTKMLIYKNCQINILKKINEITLDVAESMENVIQNEFVAVKYKVKNGYYGFELIEEKCFIERDKPFEKRNNYLNISNEYANDSIAIDNIFSLGEFCYNELSDSKIGILSSLIVQSSLEVSYIKNNKNDKVFIGSILPIAKFARELGT